MSRLRILGFEGEILETDCEVKPKGHKLKSVPAMTGIKFLQMTPYPPPWRGSNFFFQMNEYLVIHWQPKLSIW